ncbi:hypothetical protein K466DRAFT_532260 [Polyporus arcularius HHB13444]|uniref:Uncharacterized protein n=1 Tax=Polyporus arcularius HHB13444 TaxID=1314778 RepID=A0A5C3NXI2_9APHY|nr:hypothetical protein K466DRAFT_532260 [Polyporus arcularius HHB13444]
MVGDSNAELINLLDLAMVPTPEPGEESAVDDFAVALFSRLGYTKRHRVTRTRKDIPFLICGEWRYAKTDVCLIDRQQNDIILLVQEDKSLGGNLSSAECQLVAEAIAAFAQNNKRRQLCDMPIIESKVMPGITLIGTTPIFYKIPVSVELVRHVARGTYPSHSTIVSGHVPAVPRPFRRYSEGMKPVDTREAILRCYEAFKAVVGI